MSVKTIFTSLVAFVAASPVKIDLTLNKRNFTEATVRLDYHKPFYVTGEFTIGVDPAQKAKLLIDTGSAWLWSYSKYALNKPWGIEGLNQ